VEERGGRKDLVRFCMERYGTSDLVECAFKIVAEEYRKAWRREG